MRLTDQQERLIARYLREMGQHMADVPERPRERALEKAREEILGAIPSYDGAVPDDAQIESALQTVGPASRHAHRLVEGAAQTPPNPPKNDVGWACAPRFPNKTGIPPVLIRSGAVLTGLFTGPFALIVYIGAYVLLRHSNRTDRLPIEKLFLAKYVIGVIVGALLLRYLAWGLVQLLGYVYGMVLREALNLTGLWSWLDRKDGALLFWALFCLVPLAVLAGLPVPPAWRNTLRKLCEAGLAIYAVALCFGAGCALAGAIINASRHMQDPTMIDFGTLFSAM